MSEELNKRLLDLEQLVRALEDAKASYVMRSEVSIDAQGISDAICNATSKEIDRWFKSRGAQ